MMDPQQKSTYRKQAREKEKGYSWKSFLAAALVLIWRDCTLLCCVTRGKMGIGT